MAVKVVNKRTSSTYEIPMKDLAKAFKIEGTITGASDYFGPNNDSDAPDALRVYAQSGDFDEDED